MRIICLIVVFSLPFFLQPLSGQSNPKHRLLVLSDIEAEPDDIESFVRLVLYSNVIEIKGMIATTSIWHKTRVDPESIRKVVRAYGKVQPNLIKHEAGFPDANTLLRSGKARFANIRHDGCWRWKRFRRFRLDYKSVGGKRWTTFVGICLGWSKYIGSGTRQNQ